MTIAGTANDALALERAKQLFRFLKAFAERRLPFRRTIAEQRWTMPFADLPRHPSIAIGEVRLGSEGEGTTTDRPSEEPLIRVRRPAITTAPTPPRVLADWLVSGWEDPSSGIETLTERNERRGLESVTVRFTDDEGRVQALDAWRRTWTVWAEAERPARAAQRVFERLYSLRASIELESERVELMLGDGRLRWQRTDGAVDHPVLLQRVELQFDPSVPEFRILDADRAPELYTLLLQGGGISSDQLNQLRLELEKNGYHPLNREATSGYLRRLVQELGPLGEFRDRLGDAVPSPRPVVARDAVLFLRDRLSGFPAAFERVLEDLQNDLTLPASLTSLVGITPPLPSEAPRAESSPWSEPPDVLLSKPANPEQIAIARALDRHRAVLVQGPPGTGKSHTIANLIGHLVAHGKRVLVTSHTTKALRVLRDQVVATLQPLCVAVLENDTETRAQMEQSVRDILKRLTTAKEEVLEREVVDLTQTRFSLISVIDRLTVELRRVRTAEYEPIVIAGKTVEPSEAARWVRLHEAGNTWIPGPAPTDCPLPLTLAELEDLYRTTARLTSVEEREIEGGLPDTVQVLSSAEFTRLLEALEASEPPELAQFWGRPALEGEIATLERLEVITSATANDLARFEPWQRPVVAAGHGAGAERDLWVEFRELIAEAAIRWDKAQKTLMTYEPHVDAALDQQAVLQSVAEISAHLERGGTLGAFTLLFRSKWKSVVVGTRINGAPPSANAHFHALGTYLTLEMSRAKLAERWRRQAEPIGLPPIAKMKKPVEPAVREYAPLVDDMLAWWRDRWTPISKLMEEAGFRWSALRKWKVARTNPSSPFEIDSALLAGELPQAVTARLAVARRASALQALGSLEALLEAHHGPACSALRAAVQKRDATEYEYAVTAFRALASKQVVWQRRKHLLSRLASTAPGWARSLERREAPHDKEDLPGDAETAWRWRQLHDEVARRGALDELDLTRQLHQRRSELRSATAELIDRRAWLGQLRRTDLPARQALQGWALAQKRIGKGTGKRAPALQAKARELLVQARDAVPVWIMPLARVAESFDARQRRFDVVIVDEASQSDVTGLLAWYLGDHIAIVGDDKQVSPLAIGQQLDMVTALIAEHLTGVPNSHLYDGQTSIYDLARTSFEGTIALREHFRCVPDIIEFSNWLSYDGEIRPLRDPSTARRPHVAEYMVDGATASDRTGKTNKGEARMIAALVKATLELPEYDGKTMGAITLLGDEQAGLIQDVVVGLVGAMPLEQRRFAAGNAAQFQGDERHVVFLSMVDVPTGAPLALKQTELFKQRYNVAASRAKDQLWLVHSLDPNRDLKAGDLRRKLIEHVRDPSARRRAFQQAQSKAESPFEVAIIDQLIGAGYRVEPQVWIGNYRIDLVVSDTKSQVAVECDGDRFHGVDKIPEDMVRQAVLERAGWRFIRVRGTRFYRDPASTTQWLLGELTRLGIEPLGPPDAGAEPHADEEAFRDRVVRRACEIMRERGWLPPPEPEVAAESPTTP